MNDRTKRIIGAIMGAVGFVLGIIASKALGGKNSQAVTASGASTEGAKAAEDKRNEIEKTAASTLAGASPRAAVNDENVADIRRGFRDRVRERLNKTDIHAGGGS